jgi:glycosyltransferase involved in cell wall biosynthesis
LRIADRNQVNACAHRGDVAASPKINVYPADDGACGHYRVRWPAQALIDQGADVTIIGGEASPDEQIMSTMLTEPDGTHRAVAVRRPDCDVVVLQRPLTDVLSSSIPLLQAKGVSVVVEVDDDFESIAPNNTSWAAVHPRRSPRRNWRHLRAACDAADLVVVSTPALAERYGRHGRVVVVPNLIPASYLDISAPDTDEVFVGWSGSIETHPADLQECGPGVTRALRSTGARFGVVGTGRGVQRALGLDAAPSACGWVSLADYPRRLAEFDVGIVPLELSPFNEAKSWLKGLEMSAVGVPWVATPTGPYRQLHALGAGMVATRPREWERTLRRLIESPELRADTAAVGRSVAAGLTIEAHADRWWSAWAVAVNTPCAS